MSELQSILRELRDARRAHDRDLVSLSNADMTLITSFTLETLMTGGAGETSGADIRWMLFRRFDHLEEHALQIEDHLQNRFGLIQSQSQRYWSANEEARGDLYAALTGLTDDDLDVSPLSPEGEWPLRSTLSHILDTEHSYRKNCIWAIEKFQAGEPFVPMPRSAEQEYPDATLGDFLTMLDDARQESIATLANLTDEEMRAPTVWAGMDCDIRFRLMRFAQHEREHAAQIRKWRVQTGKPFTEAARLLGMVWQRSGPLDGILAGAPDTILDREPGDEESTIRQILGHIASAERYFKRLIDDARTTR